MIYNETLEQFKVHEYDTEIIYHIPKNVTIDIYNNKDAVLKIFKDVEEHYVMGRDYMELKCIKK